MRISDRFPNPPRNPKSEIRNAALSPSKGPKSQWELVDADWEVSCGKDEAPLVWALFQVLNEREWGALDIYTSPLPEGYMAVLRELAGLRNFVYMPIIFNE